MARPDRSWSNRALDACVWLAPAVVAGMLVWIIGDIAWRVSPALRSTLADSSLAGGLLDAVRSLIEFLTASPSHAGRAGGIGPILVSTALILLVCMTAALPLGLGTALLLSEFVSPDHLFGRLVRRSLDILAAVPSIVFGLFGNAFFCQLLGLKFSILSGGLTLACMVLPLLIRAAEEGFRAVPDSQRQAAAALGFSRWSICFKVVLPQAAAAIAAGLVLGIGRALAETAALLFTSGYVDRWPRSLWDSGRALSLHIYDLATNVPGGDARAGACALLLVALLAIINVVAHRLTKRILHRELMFL